MLVFLVGAGLLLYTGPGLIPSLSVLLAVGLLALAVGLNPSTFGDGAVPPSVEVIRRRWMLLLVSLVAAALFSVFWAWFRGAQAQPVAQALGLTLLVALPALLGGQILRYLIQTDSHLGEGAELRVATSYLSGMAVGALVLGQILFRFGVLPTSVLLGCVVLVSAGALTHGQRLDAWRRALEPPPHVGPESPEVE